MTSNEEPKKRRISSQAGAAAYALTILGLLLVIVPTLMTLTDQIETVDDLPIIFIILFLIGAALVIIGIIILITIIIIGLIRRKAGTKKTKQERKVVNKDEELEFVEEAKEDLIEKVKSCNENLKEQEWKYDPITDSKLNKILSIVFTKVDQLIDTLLIKGHFGDISRGDRVKLAITRNQ